jgi:hypothetical protein
VKLHDPPSNTKNEPCAIRHQKLKFGHENEVTAAKRADGSAPASAIRFLLFSDAGLGETAAQVKWLKT